MKKLVFISLWIVLLGQIAAQSELIHYDIHPKFPHHATEEERMAIPFLSQQAHLRDAVYPAAPVTTVSEFQPMSGVMIAYPLGIPVALVRELSQVIPVKVIVSSGSDSVQAKSYFNNNQVNMDNVQFWKINHDSYWTRDYGPWFVIDGHDSVNVIDFVYNRPSRPNDDAALGAVVEYLDVSRYEMPMVHTGGNYMVDGYGTAASTMLVLQENPSETTASLETMAENYLGIDHYMFLPDPLGEYIAHIDCWGKFLDVDKVLIGKVPANDPRYNNYEDVAETFANATTPWGNHYQVFRVYADPEAYRATPYTNSLIVNDHVFVPITGNSHDNEAIAVYQQAMPGYTIVPVMQNIYTPWQSTDALHCRTHELADLGMLYLKHYPLLGNKSIGETLNISVKIKALSGANLVSDSLLVYYRINSGEWRNAPLQAVSNEDYQFDFAELDLEEGDAIQYYIFAKDESGRREKHPYIGAADPHEFTITGVGLHDKQPMQIRLYPNPTTDFVTVQGKDLSEITIYNSIGQIIDNKDVIGMNTVKICTRSWVDGLYYVVIRDSNQHLEVRKMVKK